MKATFLGTAHAMLMDELFVPEGCWTGNFILEARAKGIINEEEVKWLAKFNHDFIDGARHPPPAEPPAPILSKTHEQWLKSSTSTSPQRRKGGT